VKGNHVATVVTFEITGTSNVQRFSGLFTESPLGRGVGDLNHDGQFTAGDVGGVPGAFEQILYSQNQQFDAAGDLNGDGKIDSKDLFLLKSTFTAGGAGQAALNEVRNAVLRRGDLNHDGSTNAADIDHLSRRLTQGFTWDNDLNSDGVVDAGDADTLVTKILGTIDGDANLDGTVDFNDLVKLAQNYNSATGDRSWADGDFDHDGNIDFNDLVKLAQNYNSAAPADTLGAAFAADFAAAQAATAPEPGAMAVVALAGLGLRRRRRR
jgi:MYXO-CTERM domain-containing protein